MVILPSRCNYKQGHEDYSGLKIASVKRWWIPPNISMFMVSCLCWWSFKLDKSNAVSVGTIAIKPYLFICLVGVVWFVRSVKMTLSKVSPVSKTRWANSNRLTLFVWYVEESILAAFGIFALLMDALLYHVLPASSGFDRSLFHRPSASDLRWRFWLRRLTFWAFRYSCPCPWFPSVSASWWFL